MTPRTIRLRKRMSEADGVRGLDGVRNWDDQRSRALKTKPARTGSAVTEAGFTRHSTGCPEGRSFLPLPPGEGALCSASTENSYPSEPISPLPGELAEAFQVFRGMHVSAADGIGYVADIEVATGVYRHTVRRNELRWALALFGVAKARL
jgi:hypothetical protein